MAAAKKPTVGLWVEFAKRYREDLLWMPFLITELNEDGTINGIAFTATPHRFGLASNRYALGWTKVEQGDGPRNWRFSTGKPLRETFQLETPAPEPEPAPEPASPKPAPEPVAEAAPEEVQVETKQARAPTPAASEGELGNLDDLVT